MLSKEIALSAIAKETKIPIPQILDALKSECLIPFEETSESLKILTAEQADYIRVRFVKEKTGSDKEFVASPKQLFESESPQFLPFKTVEQLANQWGIKPSDLMRLVNLTATAWKIQFSGQLDDNWEFLIARTRSQVNAKYGGEGTQTPEQYIENCHQEILKLEPVIAKELTAQEVNDERFIVNNLGEYVQEMASGDLQYHKALVQQLTLNQVDALEKVYDRSRFSRSVLVALAQRLESRTQQLREVNAINSGKSIGEHISEIRKLAGRVSQIALAPVNSDSHNAMVIRAALIESNRPG